jgi:hypothetical protein
MRRQPPLKLRHGPPAPGPHSTPIPSRSRSNPSAWASPAAVFRFDLRQGRRGLKSSRRLLVSSPAAPHGVGDLVMPDRVVELHRVDLVPRRRGRPGRRSRASRRREGRRNCNMRHGGRPAVAFPRCCCRRRPRTQTVAPHADHHIVRRCLPKLLLPVSFLSSSSSTCIPFKFSTYHFIVFNECGSSGIYA